MSHDPIFVVGLFPLLLQFLRTQKLIDLVLAIQSLHYVIFFVILLDLTSFRGTCFLWISYALISISLIPFSDCRRFFMIFKILCKDFWTQWLSANFDGADVQIHTPSGKLLVATFKRNCIIQTSDLIRIFYNKTSKDQTQDFHCCVPDIPIISATIIDWTLVISIKLLWLIYAKNFTGKVRSMKVMRSIMGNY